MEFGRYGVGRRSAEEGDVVPGGDECPASVELVALE